MASSARIEELEKKFNENPRRYFAPLANEYRKAGELEQAVALCRAYLPQQPGHMSGHIVFGQSLFDAGQLDEAHGVFETALTLDPENLIALRHLGDIARSRGDVAGARVWYQRVLDADPRNEEIAEQIAILDSALSGGGPPPAASAASEGATGWGDINPEKASRPAVSAGEPAGHAAEADSLSIEHVSAGSDDLAVTAESPSEATETSEAMEASALVGEGEESDIEALFSTSDKPASKTEDDETNEFQKLDEFEAASSAPANASTQVQREPQARTTPVESVSVGDAHESSGSGAPQADDAASTEAESPRSVSEPGELGLEVAEFVPPTQAAPVSPALGFETGHEAVVGGPIRGAHDGKASPASTPAAFVTETMAELYLQQGFVQEALDVYRQLLALAPDDAGLRERVSQIEGGARSSVSMATVSDEVVDAARRRQASPPRRSMRAFLGALAARRAPTSGDHRAVAAATSDAEGENVAATSPAHEAGAETLSPSPATPEPPADDTAFEAGEAPSIEPRTSRQHDEEDAGNAHALGAPAGGRTSSAPRYAGAHDHQASLDALFGGAPPSDEDEAAASSLANAFDARGVQSVPPISGRPARAAPTELSLDHVFRESGGDAGLQRPRSDFSFDQFFSDEADSSGQGGAMVAEAEEAPAEPREAEDDVGQFNSWLEGLKKK